LTYFVDLAPSLKLIGITPSAPVPGSSGTVDVLTALDMAIADWTGSGGPWAPRSRVDSEAKPDGDPLAGRPIRTPIGRKAFHPCEQWLKEPVEMAGHDDVTEERVSLAGKVDEGVPYVLREIRISELSLAGLAVEPVFEVDEEALPAQGIPVALGDIHGPGSPAELGAVACQLEESPGGDTALEASGDEVRRARHVPVRQVATAHALAVHDGAHVVG
jgi:hypothetical protein